MRAKLEPIITGDGMTFCARRFEQAAFDHPFHYHPEVEIATL